MTLTKTIARNINKYRKTSIKKLAEQANISQYTLQKIIYCQKKDVQVSTLQKIAKALKVKVDDLLK